MASDKLKKIRLNVSRWVDRGTAPLLYHVSDRKMVEQASENNQSLIMYLQDVYTAVEACMTRDPIYQGRHLRMQLLAWVACGQVMSSTIT